MNSFAKLAFLFVLLRHTSGQRDEEVCLPVRRGSTSSPSTSGTTQNAIQGRPGKMGPMGLRGLKGEPGIAGAQGQCTCDVDEEIRELREEIIRLRSISDNSNFTRFPWPYNGYVYSLTPSTGSWHDVKTMCRSYGARLAVVGVKDYAIRLSLGAALIQNKEVWVGISDQLVEGNWTWGDGSLGTPGDIKWTVNQPNNSGGHQDCGELRPNQHFYKMNDRVCARRNYRLCEKAYSLDN